MQARVAADGLVLARAEGQALVPWAEVFTIEWGRRSCWVATSQGMVRVDHDTAEAIERRIAPWEAERDACIESLPAEHRAGWLGLRPGETLLVAPSTSGRRAENTCLILLATGSALLAAAAIMLGHARLAVMAALPTVGLLTVARSKPRFTLSATADGVVTPAGRFRWSELRESTARGLLDPPAPDEWLRLVATRRGPWPVVRTYAGADRLDAALDRCLAERAAAAPAPSPRGVFADACPWLYFDMARATVGGAALRRAGRARLWLDDDGLWLLSPGRTERYAWSRITRLEWLAKGPRLVLDNRTIKLWWHRGGAALAHAVEEHLAAGVPAGDDMGQVTPEAIERWLGVAPGGALECRLSRSTIAMVGLSALLAALLFVALLWAGRPAFAGATGPVFMLLSSAAMLLGSARAVRADAQGLSVLRRGRRERFAWSEVTGVEPMPRLWILRTARGNVTISIFARGHDRIIGIIRRLLAAREDGLALPQEQPVPEAALSRLTGDEGATAARGLSLSQPDALAEPPER